MKIKGYYSRRLSNLEDAVKACNYIHNKKQEQIILLSLDKKARIIKKHTVAIGKTGECEFRFGNVFKLLIRDNAAGLLLAHNHPNGARVFSKLDFIQFAQLKYLCGLLGYGVLDYLVFPKGAEPISMQFRHPKAFSRDFVPIAAKSFVRFTPREVGVYKSGLGNRNLPKFK